MKMILLKILESSQENTCTEVSLCNKVARITPTNLLKKRVQHRGFTVNSVKYLTTAFLHNLQTGASVVLRFLPRILLKVFYFSQEIR